MPPNSLANPAASLALLLFFLGLVGAVVPLLPGPPLIWLGALAWAYGENFQRINWIVLALLGILALIATFSEYWIAPLTTRRAGFGFKYVLVAFMGGIAGGLLLSEVPVIGTLFGAAIGSVLGTTGVAYVERRNLSEAVEAGKAYLIGCALSSLVEVTLSLIMLGIFTWRAFF